MGAFLSTMLSFFFSGKEYKVVMVSWGRGHASHLIRLSPTSACCAAAPSCAGINSQLVDTLVRQSPQLHALLLCMHVLDAQLVDTQRCTCAHRWG